MVLSGAFLKLGGTPNIIGFNSKMKPSFGDKMGNTEGLRVFHEKTGDSTKRNKADLPFVLPLFCNVRRGLVVLVHPK